jgi:hypothetical protein
MHTVEFIPAHWLEQSAWVASGGNKLLCYSRPVEVERRVETRRTSDVELLLRSLLSA